MPHRPRFPQRGLSPFRPAMQAFFSGQGHQGCERLPFLCWTLWIHSLSNTLTHRALQFFIFTTLYLAQIAV